MKVFPLLSKWFSTFSLLACAIMFTGCSISAQIPPSDPLVPLKFSKIRVDSIAVHSGIDLYSWERQKMISSNQFYPNDQTEPFACVAGQQVAVDVQFRSFEKDTLLAIWAEGSYGILRPQLVHFRPSEYGNGFVGRDTFWFRPPPSIDKETMTWKWHANGLRPFDETNIPMYVLLGKPVKPGSVPFIEWLDYLCRWARGTSTEFGATGKISSGLEQLNGTTGNISYNAVFDALVDLPVGRGSGSFYTLDNASNKGTQLHFSLDYFLKALHAPGVEVKVICFDMASLLQLSLESIGIGDSKISGIGDWKWPYSPADSSEVCKWFMTSPIHPIGNFLSADYFQRPDTHYSQAANLFFIETGFSAHVFVLQSGMVFDATFDLLPIDPRAALQEYGTLTEDEYVGLFVAPAKPVEPTPLCGPRDVPRAPFWESGIELLRFPGSASAYPELVPLRKDLLLSDALGDSGRGLLVETLPQLHPPGIVHTFYRGSRSKPIRIASLTIESTDDTVHFPPLAAAHPFLTTSTPGVLKQANAKHWSGKVENVGFDVYNGIRGSSVGPSSVRYWEQVAEQVAGSTFSLAEEITREELAKISAQMLPDTMVKGNLYPVSIPEEWKEIFYLKFMSSGGNFYLIDGEIHFLPGRAGRFPIKGQVLTSKWVKKLMKSVLVLRREPTLKSVRNRNRNN